VGLQRRAPLRPVLVILPAGLVGVDIFSGAFLECRYRGGDHGNALGFPLLTRSLPLTRRITAITNLDAQAVRSVARLGQRDVSGRAQADHLGLAVDPIPEQPASRALLANLQIEVIRDP